MTAVYTIGHSTRSAEGFLQILRAFTIEVLADIRTVPRSRRNPQFEGAELNRFLTSNGIAYVHLADLGGLRRARKDSLNTGWQNQSFRGYADYMQTAPFEKALEELLVIASQKRAAIMCAEALPWRCHRSLVGDALLVRGASVYDIMTAQSSKPHKLTPWARVEGSRITYPSPLLSDLPAD